jgi:ClpP class serine protease
MFFDAVGSFELAAMIRSLANDDSIGEMILDVDSPGGNVRGIPELAAAVRFASERKAVTAIARPTAASAGYWVASQATRLVATESAIVGSIGVIAEHVDTSGMEERLGLKRTVVAIPEGKTEAIGGAPITDEQLARLEDVAGAWLAKFEGAVGAARGLSGAEVRSRFGAGRSLEASEALTAGAIDAITDLESLLVATPRADSLSALAAELSGLAQRMQ